jgi:hypothetical protein
LLAQPTISCRASSIGWFTTTPPEGYGNTCAYA